MDRISTTFKCIIRIWNKHKGLLPRTFLVPSVTTSAHHEPVTGRSQSSPHGLEHGDAPDTPGAICCTFGDLTGCIFVAFVFAQDVDGLIAWCISSSYTRFVPEKTFLIYSDGTRVMPLNPSWCGEQGSGCQQTAGPAATGTSMHSTLHPVLDAEQLSHATTT